MLLRGAVARLSCTVTRHLEVVQSHALRAFTSPSVAPIYSPLGGASIILVYGQSALLPEWNLGAVDSVWNSRAKGQLSLCQGGTR